MSKEGHSKPWGRVCSDVRGPAPAPRAAPAPPAAAVYRRRRMCWWRSSPLEDTAVFRESDGLPGENVSWWTAQGWGLSNRVCKLLTLGSERPGFLPHHVPGGRAPLWGHVFKSQVKIPSGNIIFFLIFPLCANITFYLCARVNVLFITSAPSKPLSPVTEFFHNVCIRESKNTQRRPNFHHGRIFHQVVAYLWDHYSKMIWFSSTNHMY